MIPPPPRPTLFPYTTLFRSDLQAQYEAAREGDIRDSQADITLARAVLKYGPTINFAEGLRRTVAWYQEWEAKAARSEEHTSELQSRRDLVCRLLLEKKNKQ